MMNDERELPMGRFSAEFVVANDRDLGAAELGVIPLEGVRQASVSGVVDTGSTRLVLPESVVARFGLPDAGRVAARFAEGRRDERRLVGSARVTLLGRSSVFTAVVEPRRSDALIGAIVLEELDLVPDVTIQALVPRDPRGIFAEID